MKRGVILPGGTAPEQLEQAIVAEKAGWDGVFVWEAPYGVDAWSLLAAMAARTSRVRLGTMLTPLPWRRPWKLASQVVTLDQISAGRALVAVGVGATTTGLPATGEESGLRPRAEMMDEGIDLMRALWEGGTSYHGKYYQYECAREDLSQVGRPFQDRIPIWTVGVWPRPKSMRRVLRCDGLLPQFQEGPHEGTPAAIREIRTWLGAHGRTDIEIIADGETSANDETAANEQVRPWAEAGCTWWLETRWELPHHSVERMREITARIAAGPPMP